MSDSKRALQAEIGLWLLMANIDGEISEHIRSCDIFIALISPDFLASNYCYDKEMQQAFTLHDERDLTIVPIVLEPCDWRASPLSRFKALPLDGKPISEWPNANTALHNVVTELRRVIEAHLSATSKEPAHEEIKTAERSGATAVASSTASTSRSRPHLPLVAFPSAIDHFMRNSALKESWEGLDRNTKRLVCTLGTKLEPIVQIAPVTPAPVVLGFECLALGPLGESFNEIKAECAGFDAGAVRICLSIAALETINYLRNHTDMTGATDLKFSLNLDPTMLDSPLLRQFLRKYRLTIQHNVTFEITEETSAEYLPQLKYLQVDFKLRLTADDVNKWKPDVKQQLLRRVEMTKVDQPSFKEIMDLRGEDPAAAIRALRTHAVRGKPLVVEGVSKEEFLEFLQLHWDAKKYGELYGQGYHLEPGLYWDREVLSLKGFGLPGGNMLRRKLLRLDLDLWSGIDGPNLEDSGATLQ